MGIKSGCQGFPVVRAFPGRLKIDPIHPYTQFIYIHLHSFTMASKRYPYSRQKRDQQEELIDEFE